MIVGTSPKVSRVVVPLPFMAMNMAYKWELLLPPPFMVPGKNKRPLFLGEKFRGIWGEGWAPLPDSHGFQEGKGETWQNQTEIRHFDGFELGKLLKEK